MAKIAKKMTKKVTKKPVKKVEKKTSKKVTVKKVIKKTLPSPQASLVKLQVGELAPEFELLDQNGEMTSLKKYRGKNVLVYFYPRAMTPGCTVQACSLRDSKNLLADQDIVVLAISADPVKSLKKFEERDHLNFKLLSDPDHKVISAYGSWGPKKFMGREFDGIHRHSFLINPKGKIIHIMLKVDTKTHHQEILELFKNQK